jgi:hypothetical protein
VDGVSLYNLDTTTGLSLADGGFLNGTTLTGMRTPQSLTIAGVYVGLATGCLGNRLHFCCIDTVVFSKTTLIDRSLLSIEIKKGPKVDVESVVGYLVASS